MSVVDLINNQKFVLESKKIVAEKHETLRESEHKELNITCKQCFLPIVIEKTSDLPITIKEAAKVMESPHQNLKKKALKFSIDCLEWIWDYGPNKKQKTFTRIRTLEMSPELREACFNNEEQRGWNR